jgi:putative membrane protein
MLCLGHFVATMVPMILILRLLFNALGLVLIAHFVPGIVVDGLYPAIVASLLLGLLNLFIRPVLIILTLPITLLTLGLFAFIINAFLFWFVASFIEGLQVNGFWNALIGSLLISVVSAIGNRWIKRGN